jgi:CubicO group peptidase (beta-lactamase class C family)
MKVSLGLVFLLFFQSVFAQYDFSAIDSRLEAEKKQLEGHVVALIYKDGKLIYQKAIGTDFNAKTQAPIASASQWLTAALVMTFVDQGKLSLDDKVSKYIPLLTKYSKGYISIRDCLAHLTGIESEPIRSLKEQLNRKKYTNLEEEITDIVSTREIVSNPGLQFRYDNIGLNMAARVLEVITKRGFEQIMAERITRPMQMRNTNFSNFNAVNPSGGAQSSAGDYMTFLAMILNKGMHNGKRILSESAIEQMETVVTTSDMIKYAPKATQGFQYGFGQWIMNTDENGKGSSFTSPGLFGTWPMIDRCRNYACIFFTEGKLNEEKRELFLQLKGLIDAIIPTTCK